MKVHRKTCWRSLTAVYLLIPIMKSYGYNLTNKNRYIKCIRKSHRGCGYETSYQKNSEDIFGMARIAWIPPGDQNGIEVYVHTDDAGRVPHFHVRKYGKKNQFEWETCIRYDSAEYFLHGRYKDKLPDRQTAKALDSMLRQKNPKRRGITYWESAVDDWNNNNSIEELSPEIVQPDYTQLT